MILLISIGSMDYIDTLLIMEDDLDEDYQGAERLGAFGESSNDNPLNSGIDPSQSQSPSHSQSQDQNPHLNQCQIGAHVANADQCHKRLKINDVGKRNAKP
jgi:hypothetical protein